MATKSGGKSEPTAKGNEAARHLKTEPKGGKDAKPAATKPAKKK